METKDILSLLLVRDTFTTESTLGKLYVNGKFFCYSLEDVVRAYGIKIYGETAIPQGIYKINITYSNVFKRKMPLLKNVINFSGIRLHGGNKAKDTLGCPCIAYNKIDDNTIQGSAEKDLTKLIEKQDKEVYITIINEI